MLLEGNNLIGNISEPLPLGMGGVAVRPLFPVSPFMVPKHVHVSTASRAATKLHAVGFCPETRYEEWRNCSADDRL